MSKLGLGFDCASQGEIATILSQGTQPSRIVYSQTCKQKAHLTYSKNNSVDLMTFDNECELFKVKELNPGAKLLLRINPKGHYKATIDLGSKFGCPLEEVRALLTHAKDLDLQV